MKLLNSWNYDGAKSFHIYLISPHGYLVCQWCGVKKSAVDFLMKFFSINQIVSRICACKPGCVLCAAIM